MPPDGKLDASGSPWISSLPRELGDRAAVAVGRHEAVVLLGREAGQRIEDVGVVGRPLAIAQSFMAAATTMATEGSSFSPRSMVRLSDLKTALGRSAFMVPRPKTLAPNTDWEEELL